MQDPHHADVLFTHGKWFLNKVLSHVRYST